mmetsp:Transcript_19502/g.46791  ORF Transcript_19502/g.46791 Transcript_19502/m.46791 type:complete len:398 (+) Transcript_19502:270-1463(+)
MAVTAAGLLADLAVARKTLNEWECGPITIDVCNSSSNDISKSINFTETIGHQRRVPKTYFVSAASHAGCRIRGSWEHKFGSIRFQCFRGKKNYSSYSIDYYNTKQRPKKKLKNATSPPVERVRKSQRPTTFSLEEDHFDEFNDQHSHKESNITCKFAFLVYWDGDLKRWFIPQKQSGCKCHNGHPHVEHPMLRIMPHHAIPINEMGVAVSSVNSNIACNLTSDLIHNRTGVQLDWNQVEYIQRKERGYAALSRDGNSTSADKLIHQLSQPGISYVILLAEYNSGLLTIRKKMRASNTSTTETTDFNEDLGNVTETPLTFAKTMKSTIRENLRLTSTAPLPLSKAFYLRRRTVRPSSLFTRALTYSSRMSLSRTSATILLVRRTRKAPSREARRIVHC